jgi:signal transduction histidine kinase
VQALTDSTPGQVMTNVDLEAKESLTKAVSLILTNLERAAKLIESFKQVSVDQVSEMRRSIDMVPYVEQIVQTLEPQLRQGRHKILVEGPLGIIAETYPGVIAQILSNLVMNAIHHGLRGREEGRILIRCEQISRDRLRLSVADDGIGISPSIVDRIFEPFFTTRRREGGTGLGLHIVQNLVLLTLEGQIKVDRSYQPGLRIVIDMPNISPLSA